MAGGTLDSAKGARLIFNDRLDAAVAGVFMLVTVLVVVSSAREWFLVLWRRKPVVARETPFVETAWAS